MRITMLRRVVTSSMTTLRPVGNESKLSISSSCGGNFEFSHIFVAPPLSLAGTESGCVRTEFGGQNHTVQMSVGLYKFLTCTFVILSQ